MRKDWSLLVLFPRQIMTPFYPFVGFIVISFEALPSCRAKTFLQIQQDLRTQEHCRPGALVKVSDLVNIRGHIQTPNSVLLKSPLEAAVSRGMFLVFSRQAHTTCATPSCHSTEPFPGFHLTDIAFLSPPLPWLHKFAVWADAKWCFSTR